MNKIVCCVGIILSGFAVLVVNGSSESDDFGGNMPIHGTDDLKTIKRIHTPLHYETDEDTAFITRQDSSSYCEKEDQHYHHIPGSTPVFLPPLETDADAKLINPEHLPTANLLNDKDIQSNIEDDGTTTMEHKKAQYKETLDQHASNPYLPQYPIHQPDIEDVFGPKILESSATLEDSKQRYKRMNDQQTIDQSLFNDPGLQANIEKVFGPTHPNFNDKKELYKGITDLKTDHPYLSTHTNLQPMVTGYLPPETVPSTLDAKQLDNKVDGDLSYSTGLNKTILDIFGTPGSATEHSASEDLPMDNLASRPDIDDGNTSDTDDRLAALDTIRRRYHKPSSGSRVQKNKFVVYFLCPFIIMMFFL